MASTATADGKAEATVARSILKAQEMFAKYLGRGDVEMQALSTFLVIAQHGRDYPMLQLQESLGLSQASVSRNVALLSIGTIQNPGPKLIEAYEDPEYRRRKVVRLTARGKKLMEEIADTITSSVSKGR